MGNQDYKKKLKKFKSIFSKLDEDSRLLVVLPALLHFRWSNSVTNTENPSYTIPAMKEEENFLDRTLKIVALKENPTEKELDQFSIVSTIIENLKKYDSSQNQQQS